MPDVPQPLFEVGQEISVWMFGVWTLQPIAGIAMETAGRVKPKYYYRFEYPDNGIQRGLYVSERVLDYWNSEFSMFEAIA